MPNTESVRSAVDKYGDMLYRICIVMLQNSADAEDAVQETFPWFIHMKHTDSFRLILRCCREF